LNDLTEENNEVIQVKKTSIRNALWLSCGFCTVAVLLAMFLGIKEKFLDGPPSEYSPDVAILTATLIALVAYVYWTYLAVVLPVLAKSKEQSERKNSLASALLSELQVLDRTLRWIYDDMQYSYDPFEYPFIEEACQNLHLFKPQTIHCLGLYYGSLRDVRKHFVSKDRVTKANPDFIKVKAQMACTLGCDLVKALQEEGGINPPPLTEVSYHPENLPDLPPRVFPEPVLLDTYNGELCSLDHTEIKGNGVRLQPLTNPVTANNEKTF